MGSPCVIMACMQHWLFEESEFYSNRAIIFTWERHEPSYPLSHVLQKRGLS